LVGVLTLGTLEDRELSDEERRLFASLASHAAAAIRRAQEQEALRAAVRARDEVLSVVAHDLKNPLNVISIAANTLLQRTEAPGGRSSASSAVSSAPIGCFAASSRSTRSRPVASPSKGGASSRRT